MFYDAKELSWKWYREYEWTWTMKKKLLNENEIFLRLVSVASPRLQEDIMN